MPHKSDPNLWEAQGRRLQEARLKKNFKTAAEAAKWLGIAIPVYLAHEQGTRQIRNDIAGFYARKFDVDVKWLLDGPGNSEPPDSPQPPKQPGPVGGPPPHSGAPGQHVAIPEPEEIPDTVAS